MKTINLLLYGNFFIAICAFAQTLQTFLILTKSDIRLNILPFFVAAATFFLYNIHKPITFFLKAQLVDNQRFIKTKTFSTPLSILSILAGLYCFYAFFQINSKTQVWLIVSAALSFAYVLPVWGRKRLRDLPYIKIFTIAFVWAFVTVILPVCELNCPINSLVGLLFLEKALFVFALTIPFDIRDMDWDAKTGVKTIPLSMGIKKAKYLSLLCLIVCIIIVEVLKNEGIYTSRMALIVSLSYIISSVVIYFSEKNRSDYFFYGLTDGMLFVQSILFFSIA